MKTLLTTGQLAFLLGCLFCVQSFPLQAQEVRTDSVLFFQFQSPNDSLISEKEVCTYSNYASGSVCYNFASCISSRWDPFNRSWTPIAKKEEKIEENGQRRFVTYSQWSQAENRWINSWKDLSYESPEIEWKERYEWDAISKIWLKLNEDYIYFNKSRQVILNESKYYQKDGNTWTGARVAFKYDTNGYQAERIDANWSEEFEKWIFDRKTENERDEEGRVLIERIFAWEEDTESWRNFWINERNYTTEGRILRNVGTQIPSGFRFIEDYTYNNQGEELLYQSFSQAPGSSNVLAEERRESLFDTDNNLILRESFSWNPDSSIWILENRDEYTYDQNSREIRKVEYRSNFGNSPLRLARVYEQEYTPEGELAQLQNFTYDDEQNIRDGMRFSYEYDTEGRRIANIVWRWDRELQEFYPSRKNENPYNDEGSVEYYAAFNWDRVEEKWVGFSMVGFTNDPQAPIGRLFRGIWNPVSESWFINQITYTYRGSCRQEEALRAPTSELSFYPNPVQDGKLSLDMPFDKSYDFELMDLQGRIIREGTVKGPFAIIDLDKTSTGVYLIRFRSGEEEILERIMIQNP